MAREGAIHVSLHQLLRYTGRSSEPNPTNYKAFVPQSPKLLSFWPVIGGCQRVCAGQSVPHAREL